MATMDMLRYQTIERHTSRHAEMGVDVWIALWEQIAAEIVLLVGDDGFDSLYARSVFLSQRKFPWLAAEAPTQQADQRLASLRASLQAQPQALAIEANRLLLVTLTDILASLIGEPLTASILDSAWGRDTPMKAGKEPNNAP